MFRLITFSSALALAAAAPAIAQQADPMTTQPAPDAPMTTQQETTPAPADTAAQPAPAAESAPQEAAPASADTRAATVAQLVETEFPSYDADKNGDLTQPEFTKWVLALHSKAEEAKAANKMDEAAKANWAKNAFATADTDKSKKVSKAEMNKFLLG